MKKTLFIIMILFMGADAALAVEQTSFLKVVRKALNEHPYFGAAKEKLVAADSIWRADASLDLPELTLREPSGRHIVSKRQVRQ